MKQCKFLRLLAPAVTIFCVSTAQAAAKKEIPAELGAKVVTRYVEIVRLSYADALATAKGMRQRIEAFAKAPTAQNFQAARDAWKRARDAYSQTEAFRFYGGPIDDPKDGPEGLINAWPMDESYVDYVKGNETAGIINNTTQYPQITKEVLLSLNEKNGEKNISTGYHAIEFLLWGQDLSLKGPGNRAHTDYVVGKEKNADRRATYLRLLAELLEEHLAQVAKAWDAETPDNYGEKLKNEPLAESLRKIYTGVINLSIDEMAGERMTVAFEKNDQENEQDCFSDYTLQDMANNERGIHNVYFGRYGKMTGPGLHDLALVIDAKAAHQSKMQLAKALKLIQSIPGTFDQAVMEKKSGKAHKASKNAIAALEAQARSLAKPGVEMGLVLNIQ